MGWSLRRKWYDLCMIVALIVVYQLCLRNHPISGTWKDHHRGGESNNTECNISCKLNKLGGGEGEAQTSQAIF